MNKLRAILIGLSLWTVSLYAGDTISNYSCDFEDEVQNLTWHFPVNADVPHQWTIGSAVNNGGKRSMYVTPKGQDTTGYVNSSALVFAYTDIILRKTDKNNKYILSFDWMAAGFTANQIDALYVFWVPDRDDLGDSIYISDQNTSFISNQLKNYIVPLNPGQPCPDSVAGKSTWQAWVSTTTSSTDSRLASAGKHRRLVFAWRNANDGPVNPAACIDNISIVDSRACGKPQSLVITPMGDDSLVLDWNGEIQGYEVGCYSYEKDVWQVVRVDTTHYVYTDVPEGFTDFYVRTICWDTLNSEEYFSAKVQASEFIYYPGRHCIDYITMSDDNCYYNTDDTKLTKTNDIDKVKWNKGMIDNGSDAKESRHTHHFSKIETDERTGGGLRTVPKGEIASTRLGNWNTGGESERAEFLFHVDVEQNPILVMKYAVVLEHPGETCKPNPGFRLRVLSNGKQVSNTCTALDFDYKKAADKEWNMYQPPKGADVRWKDWTTVGVNLEDYDGKDLQIQLTTYDCGGGGHYGYAYFTLGCAKKELGGVRCDGKPSTDFKAPDGFKYRWYVADNPDSTVATTQDFHVDSLDSRIYRVDIISPEDSDCYFTLEAMSQPRYPVSDFSYKHVPSNCRNFINITNLSRVETVYLKTNDTVYSAPDKIEWDFGVGKGNPIPYNKSGLVEFPIEGGTFPIKVTTYFNTCVEEQIINVVVPAIGEQKTDTTVYRCPGDEYYFEGHNADGSLVKNPVPYTELGVYEDTLVASTGCDSIIVTHLEVLKPVIDGKEVVILLGEVYPFHGRDLTVSGIYKDTTLSIHGCDSIIDTVNLYVHEAIVINMIPQDHICADDGAWDIAYTIVQGRSCDSYSLKWKEQGLGLPEADSVALPADDTIRLTIPTNLKPDYYHAQFIFHDTLTYMSPQIRDVVKDVIFGVYYSNDVITQRWNDVLAIRNADYNGGYDFDSVQWFVNNQPIAEATSFNYYAGDNTQLVFGAEYSALLIRKDGVKIYTCPFIPAPVPVEQSNPIPTLLPLSSPLNVPGRGTAYWYDLMGRRFSSQSYDESAIITPSVAGYYLLELRGEDKRTTHPVMVK